VRLSLQLVIAVTATRFHAPAGIVQNMVGVEVQACVVGCGPTLPSPHFHTTTATMSAPRQYFHRPPGL